MVKDKETREPFIKEDRTSRLAGDLSEHPVNIVEKKCLEKNVLVGGSLPNALRIAPPLIITEEEIDIGMDALDYAFTELDKRCQ